MNRKLDTVFDAMVASGLVSVIFAICLTAGDYLLLLAGERLLERWSMLPAGWGDTHGLALGIWAFVIALLPTAFVGWWIFRAGCEHGDRDS